MHHTIMDMEMAMRSAGCIFRKGSNVLGYMSVGEWEARESEVGGRGA